MNHLSRRAAALALGGLFACAKPPVQQPEAPPSPIVRGVDFDDLPVPLHFAQVRERSAVILNAAFRHGTLVYRGALQSEIARDWYKQVMPAQGWSTASPPAADTGAGPYVLRFEKEAERCDVRIEAPADITFVTFTLDLK